MERARTGGCHQRSTGDLRGTERPHHGDKGAGLQRGSGQGRGRKAGSGLPAKAESEDRMNAATTGFFTDSTLCIGCKACEVACKEWNEVSADGLEWSGFSYDNTGAVGASTWRHVKF